MVTTKETTIQHDIDDIIARIKTAIPDIDDAYLLNRIQSDIKELTKTDSLDT